MSDDKEYFYKYIKYKQKYNELKQYYKNISNKYNNIQNELKYGNNLNNNMYVDYIIKNKNNNDNIVFNDNNNNNVIRVVPIQKYNPYMYGGKKELSKEQLEKLKLKNTIKIIKSLKFIFKKYNLKRSKYILSSDNSLYLHNLNNTLDDILLFSKDLDKHKLYVKQDLDNKVYFNMTVLNHIINKDNDKFNFYLQKRSFKNKKIHMYKKTKIYMMDLPEILIQKLYNYNDNKDIIKLLINNIKELSVYKNKDIIENIDNILEKLNVPKPIIRLILKNNK